MKKMTYETHKPIDAPTHKKSPKSKQSQHDYTIRSEWGAKAFEFWWWKKKHKTNRSTTPRDEDKRPGDEKHVTNLPIHPRKSHAQKPPKAIWKEQARMEHIPRAIPGRIRNVEDWRLSWKLKVEISTQIRTITHTKRWTQHNQEMKNMMKIESFAASMRTQFADSYKRDGPAEIIPGTGIMNYHLRDSKKEWLPLTNVKNNTKQTDQPHQ